MSQVVSSGGRPFGRSMRAPVFYGLALGSTAPLALVAVFLPGVLGGLRASATLAGVVGAAAFLGPLLVWRRYAAEIASAGGLYAYVERAAGTNVARVHGAIWIVSYFLYLPSTVSQVAYAVLPSAYPAMGGLRPALELVIPAALVVGLAFWRLGLYAVTALVGVALVVVTVVVAAVELAHSGTGSAGIGLHVPAVTAGNGAAAASLLFVCASLPLYFGAELERATARTRRGLSVAFAVAAGALVVGALALVNLPPALLGGEVPGATAVGVFAGRGLADVVVLAAAASLLVLVLLEYVAITRLLTVMTPLRPRSSEAVVGGTFLLSCALSLLGPDGAYEQLLEPSLVALYLSLLVVFVVYPRWRARERRLDAADVVATALATALMLYGVLATLVPSAV